MPTLIVIAGLPGSGKSFFIRKMKSSFSPPALAVTDYMEDSIGNSRKLKDSRHQANLMKLLAEGKDCVIADVQFVRQEMQQELEALVRSALPCVTIKWVCFENDWIQCLKNVDNRAGQDSGKFERDATTIVQLTRRHSIPKGAVVRPVWKAAAGEEAQPTSSASPKA
jgi:predicted kinase